MSMASNSVSCTNCDFKGVKQYRPVSLVYRLADGTEVKTGRIFGWCAQCRKIKDIEPSFDASQIRSRLEELRKRGRSPSQFIGHALDKMLGGRGDKDKMEEMANLEGQLRIAELRKSMPRCLTCGSESTQYVSFNEKSLSNNFVHECGGRLKLEPADLNAPRFSFKSETIQLDIEGRRFQQARPSHAPPQAEPRRAGTDRELEIQLAATYPRSLARLQQLIRDSELCANAYTKGEKALDTAVETFMKTLGACVHGLVEDGAVTNPNDVAPAMEALNLAMWRCELTYKANSPSAFQFWKDWYAQFRQNLHAC